MHSTVNYPHLHNSLPSYTTFLVIFRHSCSPALKTVKIICNFRYVVLNALPPLPTPIQNILVPYHFTPFSTAQAQRHQSPSHLIPVLPNGKDPCFHELKYTHVH
ncbi:hypothetical protein BDR05DRAFT_727775 [Suillus weaverae]|nr:hypothetical protein BDR05DRAFT_727775 [Suillus weaverae]